MCYIEAKVNDKSPFETQSSKQLLHSCALMQPKHRATDSTAALMASRPRKTPSWTPNVVASSPSRLTGGGIWRALQRQTIDYDHKCAWPSVSSYSRTAMLDRRVAVFVSVVAATCLVAVLQLPPDPSDADLHAMAIQELMLRRLLVPGPDSILCRQLHSAGILHTNESVAWITAVADDGYLQPALVLATTIQLFSCIKERVVLMGAGVSAQGEETLRRMGYRTVRPTNRYECPNIDQQRWRGIFLRFSAFSMTEYRRLIYVDGDMMLLSNIDDLLRDVRSPVDIAAAHFERPMTRSQLASVWSDNGFNSGLMAFMPQHGLEKLVADEMASKGCVLDQPLLNHFFSHEPWRVHLLPFSYNVRKVAYHPMRAFHFAGGVHMKVTR